MGMSAEAPYLSPKPLTMAAEIMCQLSLYAAAENCSRTQAYSSVSLKW